MSLSLSLSLWLSFHPYHYSRTHFSSKLLFQCCHFPMKPTTVIVNLSLILIDILTSRRTFPINALCIRMEDWRKTSPRTSDPSSVDSSWVCCARSWLSQFAWKASISFLMASIFFTCSWTRMSQNRCSFLIYSHTLFPFSRLLWSFGSSHWQQDIRLIEEMNPHKLLQRLSTTIHHSFHIQSHPSLDSMFPLRYLLKTQLLLNEPNVPSHVVHYMCFALFVSSIYHSLS